MNEEIRDDVEQVLGDHHEALEELLWECFGRTKAAVEKLLREGHFFTTEGAKIKLRGNLHMALVFPEEKQIFETEHLDLTTTEDLDLEIKCAHHPDWETIDVTCRPPRVKCMHCDHVAILESRNVAWGTVEGKTWTSLDGQRSIG
jgi:hypothetical protein